MTINTLATVKSEKLKLLGFFVGSHLVKTYFAHLGSLPPGSLCVMRSLFGKCYVSGKARRAVLLAGSLANAQSHHAV